MKNRTFENLIEFQRRRDEFARRAPQSALILFSGSESGWERFRAASDFVYMTGFEEPESVCVLLPGQKNPYRLFVRPRDPSKEIWDGFRYGLEGAKSVFGADESYDINDFAKTLPSLLTGVETVYYQLESTERDWTVLRAVKEFITTLGRSGRGMLPIHDPKEVIGEMRNKKSVQEREWHREACRLSAESHCELMKRVRAGMNEKEIQAILFDQFYSRGAHREGYFSIIAAFDADGTLWNSDVGENFFQYQIDHCALPALQGLDPWKHYLALKKQHPPDAYLWLAQICHPFPIEQVRLWAQKAVQTFPLDVLAPQKALIAELLKRQIYIFVVSASTHWAVEAAARIVGLEPSAALGVKTKVVHGLVSLEQEGAITWREGKRTALLEKTKGIAPLFCSGNTSGDLHLLESASCSRLAVQTQMANTKHAALLADEQTLLSVARERSWLTHHFYE